MHRSFLPHYIIHVYLNIDVKRSCHFIFQFWYCSPINPLRQKVDAGLLKRGIWLIDILPMRPNLDTLGWHWHLLLNPINHAGWMKQMLKSVGFCWSDGCWCTRAGCLAISLGSSIVGVTIYQGLPWAIFSDWFLLGKMQSRCMASHIVQDYKESIWFERKVPDSIKLRRPGWLFREKWFHENSSIVTCGQCHFEMSVKLQMSFASVGYTWTCTLDNHK